MAKAKWQDTINKFFCYQTKWRFFHAPIRYLGGPNLVTGRYTLGKD